MLINHQYSRLRRGVLSSMSLLALSFGLTGCTQKLRRFDLAPVVWDAHDRAPVTEEPAEYYSGLMADAADKNVFRPLARTFYLPLPNASLNVNALDEVPNSSWFQNRIGSFDYSPEQIAAAACGDTPSLSVQGPWKVIAAKPNGAFPGFFIEAQGERYLLKFDSSVQPGRATSADVIGSKIFWAAGYHAPCNEIVYFDRSILTIAEGATAEDKYGKKQPITSADIETVLGKAWRTRKGLLRASASRFLPGKPLGPFKYQGRRADDPNDLITHERRRELRANRLLSAWLHHHDAREQNTLDVWMPLGTKKDEHYIQHYMIDWGDCLGSRWTIDAVSKRFGYSFFLDYDQIVLDTITLGSLPRTWHHLKINPEAEIFGYFNVKDFKPTTWVTEYPNSAFAEMRYDDALWMARIIARFEEDAIRAVVKEARLENKVAEKYLVETLLGRRDKILDAYFHQYAPLDRFELVEIDQEGHQALCFEDLAILRGVVDPKRVLYKAKMYAGPRLEQEIAWSQVSPTLESPARTCLQRPLGDRRPADFAPKDAAANDPRRYGVLKIWIHQQASLRPSSSIYLYFYDQGPGVGYQLVGIERPDKPVTPDIY